MLVAQSCLTLHDPMDCNLPGSSIPRILQARVLEWIALPSSRGPFPTQGLRLHLLCLASGYFTASAPWKVHNTLYFSLFKLS